MKELIDVYDLDEKFLETVDKEEHYKSVRKEFFNDGKVSKQVKGVRALLLRTDGRIIVQRRSKDKDENPNLLDKSVGGHVRHKESFDEALIRESGEELGIKAIIINDISEKNNVEREAVFKKIKVVNNFLSKRKILDGQTYVKSSITCFYIGYYDGGFEFRDGEVLDIAELSLEELRKRIKSNREDFAEDLVIMIDLFRNELNEP